ncbi:hypothetical protein MAHJHV58_46250 [Mycobacterium avium subsp. hominissuis]|uniref:MinD/ParA family ATP-binding protein n=1 Tax=Mycobacterium avium TaxID=1764 RepID=UPI000AC4A8CD|nr:MinD/ParA family protein [Mycobacterium avium]MCA4736300.1 AAA family ATPase [Mycobacterium avium subsp. hominissuis]MCA4740950.1 AAA family ATPase [Mycobacterium avium subsp. hominissuis]MCA4745467.1 AAA family ATPase [Mycobacterium avium subsp. hominissuis]MCA4765806.1 AAA family ATPase [Mycobacterium avium subsp. hominissuis]MDO2386115.1 AAA family ATPase [Mycobacterium avium subsp. hominissuis]
MTTPENTGPEDFSAPAHPRTDPPAAGDAAALPTPAAPTPPTWGQHAAPEPQHLPAPPDAASQATHRDRGAADLLGGPGATENWQSAAGGGGPVPSTDSTPPHPWRAPAVDAAGEANAEPNHAQHRTFEEPNPHAPRAYSPANPFAGAPADPPRTAPRHANEQQAPAARPAADDYRGAPPLPAAGYGAGQYYGQGQDYRYGQWAPQPHAGPPPAAPRAEPAPRARAAERVAESTSLSNRFRQERHTTELKPEPRGGWRRAVLKASFGLLNPGESAKEREDRLCAAKITANVRPAFIFAVVSGKGGSSKTTTVAALGETFAKHRGGEVVVIDANTGTRNLHARINPDANHTFEDVLADPNIRSRTDIRSYAATSVNEDSQLDVLAASQAVVRPADYTPWTLYKTVEKLAQVYSVIGIDCDAPFRSEIWSAILDMSTALIVTTGLQFDSGYQTMLVSDWLNNTGRTELLQRSFVVMSEQSPKPQNQMRTEIEEAVSPTVWADPIYVPYDPHLYEASIINLKQLRKPTVRAYLKAAARLSDWYGAPPVPLNPPPSAPDPAPAGGRP